MKAKLSRAQRGKHVVRLETSHPDGDTIDGIVIAHGEELVVLHALDGFEPDGFAVVPIERVVDVLRGPYQKCADDVLATTGVLDCLPPAPPWAGLQHLDQIVWHLHDHQIWPAVEIVWKKTTALYVGPITKFEAHSFYLFCYDAAGRWEKKYELEYDEVFRFEIESRYLRRFNAYMQAKRPLPERG